MIMADKQWFLTKVITTSLGLVTLISICIGGANILFDVKNDVVLVGSNLGKHETLDTKQWDKAWVKMEKTSEDVRRIELQTTRTEVQYKEIMRRFDELHQQLETLVGK